MPNFVLLEPGKVFNKVLLEPGIEPIFDSFGLGVSKKRKVEEDKVVEVEAIVEETIEAPIKAKEAKVEQVVDRSEELAKLKEELRKLKDQKEKEHLIALVNQMQVIIEDSTTKWDEDDVLLLLLLTQ